MMIGAFCIRLMFSAPALSLYGGWFRAKVVTKNPFCYCSQWPLRKLDQKRRRKKMKKHIILSSKPRKDSNKRPLVTFGLLPALAHFCLLPVFTPQTDCPALLLIDEIYSLRCFSVKYITHSLSENFLPIVMHTINGLWRQSQLGSSQFSLFSDWTVCIFAATGWTQTSNFICVSTTNSIDQISSASKCHCYVPPSLKWRD